jgi:uncharacterized protein (DUF362 family)
VELSTILKPGLIVVDATTILPNHGPGGPGDIAMPDETVVGRALVVVDNYAASLFGESPQDIPSIVHAACLQVGTVNYAFIPFR